MTQPNPDAVASAAPTPPTCDDLIWGKLKRVHREADDSWRHGSYVTEVYSRESDATFWEANYRLSTDGETNELNSGEAAIVRVYPREVIVIRYEQTPEALPNV